MEFRTQIVADYNNPIINHSKPVVMMGSCFTENIGKKLQNAMFDVTINPWGTLYNPESLATQLLSVLSNSPADESRIFHHNGIYHSYNHHSVFSDLDRQGIINKINAVTYSAHEKLKNASALIITYGSATVFRLIEDNSIVGNCHKLPDKLFIREQLSLDGQVEKWINILKHLFAFNPEINVIFTISPIRYKGYGFHRSQVDKSLLFMLVNELQKHFADLGKLHYFPAYEIMMDDLRDYRFYSADMIHPNDVAVDYIYDIFKNSFFDERTKSLAKKCESLTKRLNHKFLTDNPKERFIFEEETNKISLEIQKELHNEVQYNRQ